MFKKIIVLASLSFLFLISCEKNQVATISGHVMHHEKSIGNAHVYVKYDTNFFPGENLANYDLHIQADEHGHFSYDKLPVGEFYLYAFGWDDEISDSVFGGIPGEILKKTKNIDLNIPVVE